MDMNLSKLWARGEGRETWNAEKSMGSQRGEHDLGAEWQQMS